MKRIIIPMIALALAAVSCSTPANITYFQDNYQTEVAPNGKIETNIKLKPGDKVSIIVTCSDQRLTNLLNLPYVTQRLGQSAPNTSNIAQGVSGYTLDSYGNIDFPSLGFVHLAGLTREEVAEKIKDEIVNSQLAKDPVVTVEYMNLSVAVFGEVAKPGRYFFDKDNFTIVDAISRAGDLTIYGQRESVKVLREENGVENSYIVDLTSMRNMVSSPVYYLQQNDIVYVEPNDVRKRQSTVNGNNVRTTSFWISLASLASTLVLTIINVAGRIGN